jgi:hypothetical protein
MLLLFYNVTNIKVRLYFVFIFDTVKKEGRLIFTNAIRISV